MATEIKAADLAPDVRKAMGIKLQRETTFNAEDVACHALKALAAISNLSRGERDRVLRHAMKINKLKVRGD